MKRSDDLSIRGKSSEGCVFRNRSSVELLVRRRLFSASVTLSLNFTRPSGDIRI